MLLEEAWFFHIVVRTVLNYGRKAISNTVALYCIKYICIVLYQIQLHCIVWNTVALYCIKYSCLYYMKHGSIILYEIQQHCIESNTVALYCIKYSGIVLYCIKYSFIVFYCIVNCTIISSAWKPLHLAICHDTGRSHSSKFM